MSTSNNDNFNELSRTVWKDIRQGTPFQQPDPECIFQNGVYGAEKGEGINFKKLVEFIKKVPGNPSQVFKWSDYAIEPTKVESSFIDGYTISENEIIITNNIEFEYIDLEKKQRKVQLTGILNKNICFIETDRNLQRGYRLDFNYTAGTIKATLSIYYENTEKYRRNGTSDIGYNTVTIDDKYKAVKLTTTDLTDFAYLAKEIYDEDGYQFVIEWITVSLAAKLNASQDPDYINFIYKRLPDFVIPRLNQYITKEKFFEHFLLLKIRDEMSWTVDSSSAVIKLLRAFNDSKLLYQLFKKYPNELKQIFYNLDKTSTFEGQKLTNKMIFAVIVMVLCVENKYDGFPNPYDVKNKANIPTFKIGGDYKVNTNIRPGRDKFANEYTMTQQQLKEYRELINAGKDGKWYETFKKYFDIEPPEYLHPLEPVFFIDLRPDPLTGKPTDETPVIVPAMYVKAIAHEEEVADIFKLVRVLGDLLAIVIGAFTFGSSSFLFRALSVLEIAIAAKDLNVVANEDELMKTPEGREYLALWNKIALYGGIPTAAITLIRGAYKLGAFLLGKATINETNAFLKITIRELLEKSGGTNYIPGSIQVLSVAEAKAISGLGYSLAEIKNMYSAGVVFVKGDVQIGQKVAQEVAAVYNGKLIASGTADIKATFSSIDKSDSALIAKSLDDLPEIRVKSTEADLLETWDNLPVSKRGRRLGQRLLKADLRRIKKFLADMGYDLELFPEKGAYKVEGFRGSDGGPHILIKGAQASFVYTSSKAKFCLRQNCTIFELFHELMHGRHAKKMGLKKYYNLGGRGRPGELLKEQNVFDKILEYKDLFTRKELTRSLDYINEVREKFGQNPLSFSFDIETIPHVRKEISVDMLLKIK